jgi:hypothetical protein
VEPNDNSSESGLSANAADAESIAVPVRTVVGSTAADGDNAVTPGPAPPTKLKRGMSRSRVLGLGLLCVGVAAAILLGVRIELNKNQAQEASLVGASQRFTEQTAALPAIGKQLATINPAQPANSLTVNGSLVLAPTTQPASPVPGELYYDQTANQLQYYNGTDFVHLQGGTVNNTYNNTTVNNTYGVTGTPANNTYLTDVTNVTNVTNTTGSSIQGTAGTLAMFGSSGDTLADSLVSENGTSVRIAGATDIFGSDGTPGNITVRGGQATGSNAQGATITVQGSNGTGGANGGDILFQTGQAAEGGIQIDAADVSEAQVDHTDGTTTSMAFTVGTQEDRVLLVGTGYTGTEEVTYDGIPLTELGSVNHGGEYAGAHADLWYLLNPPSGTHSIVATINPAEPYSAGMGAEVFFDVDQSTPFGTFVSASGSESGSGAASLSVPTTNTSQVVVDTLGLDNSIPCTSTGSGQTVAWSVAQTFIGTSCGSYTVASVGATTISYQLSQTSDWVDVGVALNPAVPGSTPLQVVTGSSPDPMDTRLDITATGNVGIDNANPQYGLDVAGTARFENAANSTGAFQVQNSAGSDVLNVDTANARIGIGTNIPTQELEVSNGNVQVDYGGLTMLGLMSPSPAPTATATGTGVLNGTYYYEVTYVTANGGETNTSNLASVAPVNQEVSLTNIPIGPSGVVARRIYRSTADAAYPYQGYLLTTIDDNTTTTYTDNTPDVSLGAAAPNFNTTSYISNPQGQGNSEAFGLKATVGAGNALAVGNSANAYYDSTALGASAFAVAGNGVAVGNTSAASYNGTAVGYGSVASNDGVAIGSGATNNNGSSLGDSIAIGFDAANTDYNQLVIGGSTSNGSYIQNAYIGSGAIDATPQSISLHATGGSGTNIAGANITLAGGIGTGTADGGNIAFQIAAPGGTSGTAANSLSTVATISGINGAALYKNSANSTTAFQIQDSSNNNLLNIDTSGDNVNIGATGTSALSTTTNVGTSTGAAQNVNVGSTYGASTTTIQGGTGGVSLLTGSGAGTSGSISITTGASSTGASGGITIDAGSNVPTGTQLEDLTFEDGTTDNMIVDYGLSTISNTTAQAHIGTRSLAAVENNSSWGAIEAWPGTVNVTPGHIYAFTAWVRGSAAESIIGGVYWIGPSLYTPANLAPVTDTTTGWTEISGELIAPAGASTETFYVYSGDGTGSATDYVDDITVTDMSSTNTPAINIGATNAQAVTIGNTNQTAPTTIHGGLGGVAVDAASGGSIALGTANDDMITLGNNTGVEPLTLQGNGITQTLSGDNGSGASDTIQTTTDSTTAFQVQNASGLDLLNVDTTASAIGIGSLPTQQDGYTTLAGTANAGGQNGIEIQQMTTGSAGTLSSISVYFLNADNSPNNKFQVAIYADDSGAPGSLIASSGANTISPGAWNTANLSATLSASTTYWLAVEENASSGTKDETVYNNTAVSYKFWYPGTSVNGTTVAYGAWPSTFTGGPAANFSANEPISMYANVTATTGAYAIATDNNGHVGIGTGSASSLYQLQIDSPVPSGYALNIQGETTDNVALGQGFSVTNGAFSAFNVDTLNREVEVNGNNTSANAAAALNVYGSSGNILNVMTSIGTPVVTVGSTGAATFENSTDSTTAFQVQNSGGSNLLGVDTTNSEIVLGIDGATPTATGIRGGAAAGNNLLGANLNVDASDGTGVGGSGNINFYTAGGVSNPLVTFDSANGTSESSASNNAALTWSHTTGAEGNMVLIVTVDAVQPTTPSATPPGTATSVTYNGVALTELTSQSSIIEAYGSVWYLANPPSGAHNVVVNFTGPASDNGVEAATFYNVDTTNPIGAFTTHAIYATTISTTLSGTNAGEGIYDAVMSRGDWGTTPTAGPGQTGLYVAPYKNVGSFRQGVADATTMSWTGTGNGPLNHVVMALNPEPNVTPDPLSQTLSITQSGTLGIDLNSTETAQAAISFGGSSAHTIAVNQNPGTGSGQNLTIQAGGGAVGANNGGNLFLQGGLATGTGTGGSVIVEPQTDSTAAFKILQNSGGTALLTADTSNLIITIGGSSSTFATLNISNGHLESTQTTAPTIGTPINCGTNPTAAVTTGTTDSTGSFTVTAGTGSPTTCDTTVTFNKTYTTIPKTVILTASLSVGTSPQGLDARVSNVSTTGFTIQISPTSPAASTLNAFYYLVIE